MLPSLSPRVVSALLAFLVAFGLFWFLIHRPGLHIGKIRIIGATYVTREEVLEEGGLWEPINVLDIDRKQLIQNLEKDVRIEKASISFAFPTYFDIHITERLPGLYVECDGPQFAKVSYSGHVLAVHSSIPDATAPLLTGYHGGNLMEGCKGALAVFGPLGTFHSGPDYGSFHGWAEADHYPSAPEPSHYRWRCGKCQQKDRYLCDALPGNGEPEIQG